MSKEGITSPIISLFATENERKQIAGRHELEKLFRMYELAQSLGEDINSISWYRVALKLAQKHEPKLQNKSQIGRPKKWTDMHKVILAIDIKLHVDSGISVKQALKELSETKRWSSFLEETDGSFLGPDKAEALKKQYKSRSKNTELADSLATNMDLEIWQSLDKKISNALKKK